MDSSVVREKRFFLSGFLLHVHPAKVSQETLRFSLSFGLGGMGLTLFLVLILTGLLQLITYNPEMLQAYRSVNMMYEGGNMAGWLRNVHYWSGNLLVIVSFLHLCRVFLTGAIAGKRHRNWIVGLFLFGLVIFSNFSGYLLPWDQLAFWAVTIFTSMLGYIPFVGNELVDLLRGGSEVGAATLNTFYILHTGFLPATFALLLMYHFWLVRKAGGLVTKEPRSKRSSFVAVKPNLIVRELATASVIIAAVCVFGAFVDAPLEAPANAGMSPNPAKAAWFFLGLQELLMHLHPSFAICVLPVLIFLSIVLLPLWKDGVLNGGVWFGGKRGGRLALVVVVCTILLSIALVIGDESLRTASTSVATDIWSRGIYPIGIVIVAMGVIHFFLTRKCNYTSAESVMTFFLGGVVSIICLTIIGIWFRGPGMVLIWP